MSEKSRLVSLLFCTSLGFFGGHRFYVGKVGTGLIWLFTFGVFGIGWIVDLIAIMAGTFRDKDNKPIMYWFRVSDPQGTVLHYFT